MITFPHNCKNYAFHLINDSFDSMDKTLKCNHLLGSCFFPACNYGKCINFEVGTVRRQKVNKYYKLLQSSPLLEDIVFVLPSALFAFLFTLPLENFGGMLGNLKLFLVTEKFSHGNACGLLPLLLLQNEPGLCGLLGLGDPQSLAVKGRDGN